MSRDPSYPDRARIDSDVRAFLRPASSPWIVFDRDSRIDDFAKSALRLGAVFASTPSFRPSVVAAAEQRAGTNASPTAVPAYDVPTDASGRPLHAPPTGSMFPPSVASPESSVEPSSVAVSSDLSPEPELPQASDAHRDEPASERGFPPRAQRRRTLAAAVGALGALVLAIGVSAAAIGVRASHEGAEEASANLASRIQAPPVEAPAAAPRSAEQDPLPAPAAAPEPPAEMAAPPSPAADTAEAEPAAKPAASARAKRHVPPDPKKRFARLRIRGAASYKNVYLNGKRLLGHGQRSFRVFCGMHTIAVGNKSEAKDVEIPCNGEYVVSK